jgi:hypothetical protein
MKDLEIKQAEPSISISQEVRKHLQHIGTVKKIKGLTMFELNIKDMTLQPAIYKETVVVVPKDGKSKIVNKLIVNEGCYYVQALNKKNAYKKLAKTHKYHGK